METTMNDYLKPLDAMTKKDWRIAAVLHEECAFKAETKLVTAVKMTVTQCQAIEKLMGALKFYSDHALFIKQPSFGAVANKALDEVKEMLK